MIQVRITEVPSKVDLTYTKPQGSVTFTPNALPNWGGYITWLTDEQYDLLVEYDIAREILCFERRSGERRGRS